MTSQPFYVGYNNPRFRGVSSDGYLPALVSCDDNQLTPDNDDTKHQEPVKQWQQLRGMVLYLQKQIVELATKKRKEDYLYE